MTLLLDGSNPKMEDKQVVGCCRFTDSIHGLPVFRIWGVATGAMFEIRKASSGLLNFCGEDIFWPGTPSVLFLKATLPLKPATIALKIGHLAFQGDIFFLFPTFPFLQLSEKPGPFFGCPFPAARSAAMTAKKAPATPWRKRFKSNSRPEFEGWKWVTRHLMSSGKWWYPWDVQVYPINTHYGPGVHGLITFWLFFLGSFGSINTHPQQGAPVMVTWSDRLWRGGGLEVWVSMMEMKGRIWKEEAVWR